MDGSSEAAVEIPLNEVPLAQARRFDLETVFHAQYQRLARVIARVIRDHGRAEELAVDVLLKWSRHPNAQGDQAGGWLYRTAVRAALNELRREGRRGRYERLFGLFAGAARVPTPEDVRAAGEASEQVRSVLRALRRRHAELLILRSHGLSYEELAATLSLNPASIGTLLTRAQLAFRKEYTKRYGTK
jgi:RNA polymerase sigma-70 factor (ECF subfamily)